jgi:hypothetical protein
MRRGAYEENPDGSGVLHWTSLKGLAEVIHRAGLQGKFSLTVSYHDLTFTILDNGFQLKDISILKIKKPRLQNWGDAVLIPKGRAEAFAPFFFDAEFMKADFPPNYLIYIRRSRATRSNG